jgi:1,2-diacylglycerol 3-beta-galactosyltransferase
MTAPTRQRKVLFLIADTGAGHRSAANAIHHAMRVLAESPSASSPAMPSPTARQGTAVMRAPRTRANDGWQATIVDAFVECSRFPLRRGVSLYAPAIKYSPRLYGQFFHVTNTTARFQAANRLVRPFLYQGLRRLFLEIQPDVIVSVHPLLNHISLQVLRDLDARIPFLTVITDLFTVHCAWIAPGVTACVVPTEAARQMALDTGMATKRIHYLGMPIDPKFARSAPTSREELRVELGLDPALPTVLLVGGGEGAIGLAEATRAIGYGDFDVQMLVVTGRNKQLFAQLKREQNQFRVPTQVLGFVNNMPDLMHAADVIVTKAGPGTITEAMACELPIIPTGAIPGQEEGNLDFVLEHDLGLLARTSDALVDALRELLTPGSPRLEQLRANVRAVSRPEASFDIARLVLKHLPEPSSPSQWERVARSNGARRYRLRGQRRLPQRAGMTPRPSRISLVGANRPLRRGATAPLRAGRTLLRGLSLSSSVRADRLRGLTDLRGARALLLRGTQLGKVQLRRPGRRGGRHDARPPYGGRSGSPFLR